ncbi:MAG TPA: transcriptional regulator [Clostridiales bacterium]|nr:transcriptional regulator [Clostridiales bacterium]
MLGIRQTVYSRYERGFQSIPVEHLLVLADLYNTSIDYILGRTNEIKPYPKIKPRIIIDYPGSPLVKFK